MSLMSVVSLVPEELPEPPTPMESIDRVPEGDVGRRSPALMDFSLIKSQNCHIRNTPSPPAIVIASKRKIRAKRVLRRMRQS
jgi:hypothetical protein